MPYENALTNTILSRHLVCMTPKGGLLLRMDDWLQYEEVEGGEKKKKKKEKRLRVR